MTPARTGLAAICVMMAACAGPRLMHGQRSIPFEEATALRIEDGGLSVSLVFYDPGRPRFADDGMAYYVHLVFEGGPSTAAWEGVVGGDLDATLTRRIWAGTDTQDWDSGEASATIDGSAVTGEMALALETETSRYKAIGAFEAALEN